MRAVAPAVSGRLASEPARARLALSALTWAAFLVVGVVLYADTGSHPFVYDDLHSIKYNPHIRDLSQVPRYFTDLNTFSSQRTGYMFRPALLITYALNYSVGGQSPAGYRWVNLALHLTCAGLCFSLALRLLEGRSSAVFLGLLFLLHPAHTEVVNYISARSDSLAAALYLACLWLVLTSGAGAGIRPGRGRRVLGCGAYALALLTKSVALTAPGLLWAWDAADRRGWIASARRHAGLWAVALVYLCAQWLNGFLAASAAKAPRGLLDNVWTQLKALVYYPFVFAMPTRLSVEHAFGEATWPWGGAALLSLLCLVSLSIVALHATRLQPLRRAWLWYLVALAPYAVAPLNILVGERRAYLASGGLLLAAAWAWGELRRRRPAVALIWGGGALLCLGILSAQRNAVWATEVGLWGDAVAKAPASARARLNLALAHRRAGHRAEAERHLEQGLAINPQYGDAWVVRGDMHMEDGDAGGAEAAFGRALALNPDQAGVYHNLGCLRQQGGDLAGAVEMYEAALAREPRFVEARNNLGQALEGLGQPGRALEAYERAVADSLYWVNTDDPVGGAWYNLARLREAEGHTRRAAEAYERAHAGLRHDPRYREFARRARAAADRLRAERGTP